MTWQIDMVLMVRSLIGDLDSTKYTDERIKQLTCVGAYNVNTTADFTTTYTITIGSKSISPDPVDEADLDFVLLTAYKTAVIILGSEVKTESGNSISIKDGPSAIDLRGVASSLNTLYKDLSQKYEEMMNMYQASQSANNGQAILTPYSPASDFVNWSSYLDYRSNIIN
tara:strand:+ start:1055 stop:1561 length:507 start_codon:yes stop_codon:yes gene_type:complete